MDKAAEIRILVGINIDNLVYEANKFVTVNWLDDKPTTWQWELLQKRPLHSYTQIWDRKSLRMVADLTETTKKTAAETGS